MSRQPMLRQAFVVTVAIAAVGACNTVTTTTFSDCPADRPAHGEQCSGVGDECSYGTDDCGSTISATCGDDGVWKIGGGESCNPPFVEPPDLPCPIDAPMPDAYCTTEGQYCEYYYGDICEEVVVSATCINNGWNVFEDYYYGECNPPPAECPIDLPIEGSACPYDPESWDGYPSYCLWDTTTPCGDAAVEGHCAPDQLGTMVWTLNLNIVCQANDGECGAYDAEAGCADDATCQWLTPGCDGLGNEVVTGCYAKTSCTSDPNACGAWGTCAKVSYDPCYNAACQACSADIDICLPNATP